MTNNLILTAEERAKIYLQNEAKTYKGKSFVDVTLNDFCEDFESLKHATITDINKALKECGIKPISVKEISSDIGSYIVVGRNDYLIRKGHSAQGECFKSQENFEHHPKLPCYACENSDIDEYYTAQDFLAIADGDKDLAKELFDTVDWQHVETLAQEWEIL